MVLPKKGRKLPKPASRAAPDFAEVLAAALRLEFEDRRHAVKVVMRWTGASGRTVRYWFAAAAVPNGHHLIAMIARSDAVLETVLAASRRVDLLEAFFDLRRVSQATAVGHDKTRPARRSMPDRGNRGPDGPDGPDPSPTEGCRETSSLNERQMWFLEELTGGGRPDAAALLRRFGVSVRTAKRDIARLKVLGRLRFIGTRRRGRYDVPSPSSGNRHSR